MGFWSGVCSFVSSACSCIGGAISSVASSLSSVLSIAGGGLASAITGVIRGVAEILGVGDKEEKLEELGLKVEKSEKRFEDFDSYKEYKEHLDSMKLDREELEKLKDPDKKDAYSIIGQGVYLAGINEHYEMKITPESLLKIVNLGIKKPEDAKTFLDECKDKDVEPDLEGLTKGELTNKEMFGLIDALKDSTLKMENKDEISLKLDKMLEEL